MSKSSSSPLDTDAEIHRIFVGATVCLFREGKGLSQDELAHRAEFSQATICRTEHPIPGKRKGLSEEDVVKTLLPILLRGQNQDLFQVKRDQIIHDARMAARPMLEEMCGNTCDLGTMRDRDFFRLVVGRVGLDGFMGLVLFVRKNAGLR